MVTEATFVLQCWAAHRIIAGHALVQPDDLCQAQHLAKLVLDLLAGEVRVARRVQQRLLRRDQRPAIAQSPSAPHSVQHQQDGVVFRRPGSVHVSKISAFIFKGMVHDAATYQDFLNAHEPCHAEQRQ